jgi:hypothetical protein
MAQGRAFLARATRWAAVAALALGAAGLRAAPPPAPVPGEPRWHEPEWQVPLVNWLKGLKKEDVHTEAKAFEVPELSEAEARRLLQVAQGADPLANFMASAAALPDEDFLWAGGIWRKDLPLQQAMLKDASHELKSGQLWLPSHPTTATFLALAWSLDEPWNPYRKDPAVARRAAAVAIADLLAQAENVFYYSNPASSKEGARYGFAHPGQMGFTLTFSAFTLLKVKEALPPEVVKNWSDALQWFAEGTAAVKPMGPMNMRLSLPVALHYGFLATGRPVFKDLCEQWQEKVTFGPEFSPAGHYWEGTGRSPDGSYNGIGLHRVAEMWSLSKDPRTLDVLRKAYRLKTYLTLVEPDGKLLGASHFNDRDTASFANDQFAGREIQFGLEVPDALPFLARIPSVWTETIDVARVRKSILDAHKRPSARILPAHGWGMAGKYHDAPHQWGMVATLPYFLYQENAEALAKAMTPVPGFPITTKDQFTEDFNHEFFVVRRPGYHATLYTGRVTPGDSGATNVGGMLQEQEGGIFNGFGGGGLSSFWTPPAGTLLLGRHSAGEGYERTRLGERLVPGWQDWANHHVVGRTVDNKVLTSARVPQPDFQRKTEGEREAVIVEGTMPNHLRRHGAICNANVSYRRRFDFLRTHMEVATELRTDQAVAFKALYETLPIHLADDTRLEFLDARGKPVPSEGVERVAGVREMLVLRKEGGVRVVFAEPAAVALVSVKVPTHRPPVVVRALQVEFPTQLEPGTKASLRYALVPCAVKDGQPARDATPPLFAPPSG